MHTQLDLQGKWHVEDGNVYSLASSVEQHIGDTDECCLIYLLYLCLLLFRLVPRRSVGHGCGIG